MTKQEILLRIYHRLSIWSIEDSENDDINMEFYTAMLKVRLDIAHLLTVKDMQG